VVDGWISKVTTFNPKALARKADCIEYLRELGIRGDWSNVRLGEMREILAVRALDQMLQAAKAITERNRRKFKREDFVL
jgi:hypothetical protein